MLNRTAGQPGDTFEVSARRVVLSAGAYYTPLILKKSNIGRRSKELGKNLTLHPAFRVMAKFDQKVEGWNGAMQNAIQELLSTQKPTRCVRLPDYEEWIEVGIALSDALISI